jgi:protease-4
LRMAGKKHPILTVLIILVCIALVLGTAVVFVLKMVGPSSSLSFRDKIGVIPIEGAITHSERITSELVRFTKDDGIKAIILRIDSPGGAVGPTQEIYREVLKTTETKKVVASMGGVAASGGYYIAAAADQIVANPATITGSICVLMEFVQVEDLLSKIGISFEVLKSGEYKDTGSPHRKLTEREKKLLETLIADIQRQFVEAVSEGRGLAIEKVQEIADGRILTGSQALEVGLVDALGNFQDAVELTKKIVGIKGEATLVYSKKSKMELLDLFFESAVRSFIKLFQGMKTQVEYRWSGILDHRLIESY